MWPSSLRLLLLICALDVRVEIHAYDLKGTGDLSPLRPVAHRYRAGDEDEDIEYLLLLICLPMRLWAKCSWRAVGWRSLAS